MFLLIALYESAIVTTENTAQPIINGRPTLNAATGAKKPYKELQQTLQMLIKLE
ncbi:hypothetical protein [Wolbachia endosymbiont (group A) of Clivina fossor]|uniref:hypothetical protein n=1 Tax=Wolbachia endosymbiont (group A) of Clivina fossor TaxID=3066133 RepID=UPI003132E3A4